MADPKKLPTFTDRNLRTIAATPLVVAPSVQDAGARPSLPIFLDQDGRLSSPEPVALFDLSGQMLNVGGGRGVASVLVDSSGHLIVTYTDGATQDAGYIGGGGTPTPTPAPSFTTQPTITGTVKVGQPLSTLTYNDGVVANGTITTRAILLAGVATLGTYVLVDADLGKAVTYRNIATGVGSPATATSAAVTVQAATVTPTPTPTPGSLALDFMGASYVGAAPTSSRNAPGYAETNSGALISFAANTLRRTERGLISEPAATNYGLQSQSLVTAPWTTTDLGTGGTTAVVPSAAVVPDGTATAQRVTINRGSSNQWAILLSALTVPAAGRYAASLWVRAASAGDVGKIVALGRISSTVDARNLVLTSAWQRLVAHIDVPADELTTNLFVGYSPNATPNSNQTGAVAFDVWQAGMEAGQDASSEILTTTAAATRPADATSFTVPSGASKLTLTLDDASNRVVPVTGGANYTLPTVLPGYLAKPYIRRVDQGQLAYAPPAFVYNAGNTAASTKIVAMRDRIIAGTGRGLVIFAGDSQFMGAGTGDGALGLSVDPTNVSRAFPVAIPQRFAALANAAGMPSVSNSLIGDSQAPIAYNAYDSRVTLGGWGLSTIGTTGITLGGALFRSVTNGDVLTLTPTAPFTTVDVMMSANAVANTTVKISGNVATPSASLPFNGGNYVVQTYTVARGTYPVAITSTSATEKLVGWIVARDGGNKLDVLQAGRWGGYAYETDSNTAYGAATNWTAIGHDVAVLAVGSNDISSGTATAGNHANIVTAAKRGGAADVILCSMPPQNPAVYGRSYAAQRGYWDSVKAVADAQGCIFIDFYAMFSTYEYGFGRGWYWDQIHQSGVVQAIMADVLRDVIMNVQRAAIA